MKTILVTGGCGAIGSEVINRLKALHKDVLFVNLDALTYAGRECHVEPPYDNYVFVHGDICDSSLVSDTLMKYKPSYILHLAAETHVDNSFGNSLVFTTTNVFGTHNLLECVRRYISEGNRFEMFLHMSTDEVYGSVDDDEPARTESSLFAPSNPYAATKVGAEMICTSYNKSFKVPIIILRCNNAISKNQHEEKLIPKIINCLMNKEKIPVHGQGASKRTFIHAYDIADAIDVIIEKGKNGHVYNIGSTMEYTVLEVVGIVLKLMKDYIDSKDISDHIEFVADRAFQDLRYHIDTSVLRELGWTEKISFEDAIRDVIANLKKLR